MTDIRVKNPALFDRLRIQALLRGIADERGEQEMLKILEQALTTEFRREVWQVQYTDQEGWAVEQDLSGVRK